MARHVDAERCALYRFYDADDQLLYVGISRRPDTRWAEHRHPRYSPWSKFVASRTLSWFASRTLAEAAEVAAIKDEKPRFNGSHNFVKAAFTPEVWAEPITSDRKRGHRRAGPKRDRVRQMGTRNADPKRERNSSRHGGEPEHRHQGCRPVHPRRRAERPWRPGRVREPLRAGSALRRNAA